jgi:uncharacterized protein (DUF885 family)
MRKLLAIVATSVPLLMGCAIVFGAGARQDATVDALANELLAHLRATNAYVRLLDGLPVTRFDPITFTHAQQEAQFNKQMLARLGHIQLSALTHEEWLLAGMLRQTFLTGSHADENYWFSFAVTPYAGGQSIGVEHSILAAQSLETGADRDRYLGLLDSYATMLRQTQVKTRAQAERDIRVPKPAIAGVVATFRGFHESAAATLVPSQARLAHVPADQAAAFLSAVRNRISAQVLPGYDAIVAIFDDGYTRAAPDEVGIGRFPGGKECYLRLITDYTGLKLTPEEVHDLGVRRIAELDQRMQTIRNELGFKGSRREFQAMLRQDARFQARSATQVEERYLQYVARMKPRIPEYFSVLPKAPYGVRRLSAAAEKGMTYGYYEPPTPADPAGHYNYNGSDLDKRSLVTAEHLIYHELIPGHHLHMALQFENARAHPVQKFLDFGAFAEGWGEYAASLGEEMGLYSDPYDLYGHLALQEFLASRLVVDTGMNYFNMPLAEARAYMQAHTFESDVQIASETLRYSTDIYAQALSYRLGYDKFWELRHRAEQALGKGFDIRDFHAAAVGEGAMPLNVLEEHIDWFIAQRRH